MTQRDHHRLDAELLRVLQRGDPAGEGGLTPAQRDGLRRQILAAAKAPGRASFPGFRALGYSVAGLAALMAGWLALQHLPQHRAVPPTPPALEQVPLVVDDRSGGKSPALNLESPSVQAARQPAEEPAENLVPQQAPASANLPSSEPGQLRQLQFIVGATRVIWTLDPDFDLGPSSAAEQGETS